MYQGCLCDDIASYNRTHEMTSILTSKANRQNGTVADLVDLGMTKIITRLTLEEAL